MQNVVISMCEKFHNDRLRNDRALGNQKSDNNLKNMQKKSNDFPQSMPVKNFDNRGQTIRTKVSWHVF